MDLVRETHVPLAFEAKVLSIFSEGPGFHHLAWEPQRRVFNSSERFGSREPDYSAAQESFESEHPPSAEQWSDFWRILDEIGGWQWQGSHSTGQILDGGDWYLEIEHQGRSLKASGTYCEQLPYFFDLFERSLHAIAGIKRPWPGAQQLRDTGCVSLENVCDLVPLAEVVGAVIRSQPHAAERFGKAIHDNLLFGRTLLDLLDTLGAAKSPVLPSLLASLRGDDEQAYWNLTALKKYGVEAVDAIPTLLELHESQAPWHIIEAATAAIVAIAPDDDRVSARVPILLRDETQFRRLRGLQIVSASRFPNADALDALADQFDETDTIILDSAVGALRGMLQQPQLLVSFLRRPVGDSSLVRNCLSHTQSRVRWEVLDLLAALGEMAQQELPSIISLLLDPEALVRRAAVHAIGEIAHPEDALAFILDLLEDAEECVRRGVVLALAEMGSNASPAIPRLLSFLESATKLELEALEVTCKILGDADEIVRAFQPLLEHDNPEARAAAVRAIGTVRGDSWQLVEILIRAMDDPNVPVRDTALWHLRGLQGELAKLALPALCDALKHPGTCASAANTLSTLREDAIPAIPALVEILNAGRIEGTGALCVARTLYVLSPEFAEQCPPEVAAQLTRFCCEPIWRKP